MLTDKDIEQIFDTEHVKLYRFFYYKVLSREKAEDLTSDTFLTFVSMVRDQKDIHDPLPFLYGIAKNTFLKYLRKKYREVDTVPLEHADWNIQLYIDRFLETIDRSPSMEQFALPFIQKLPEKQQNVLFKRLIEKKNLKEIAEELGKSINYVKTTQKRGIKNLRRLLATTFT